MTRSEHVPVLIVGAGPAGLVTATTLADHGVASLVLERRPAPSDRPRATGITARSMEILRSWRLEEQACAGAPDVEWLAWEGRTLADLEGGSTIQIGSPTRAQFRVLTPAPPACQGQQHVELLLESHLRALGVARVERGTALEPGIDHIVAVTFTSRLARRFRHGHGFLAGDAAHQATPRGGTGLNAAIQDTLDGNPVAAWPPGVEAATAPSAGIASATARNCEPRHAALAA